MVINHLLAGMILQVGDELVVMWGDYFIKPMNIFMIPAAEANQDDSWEPCHGTLVGLYLAFS